jgi:hypothetical protein
MGDDQSPSSMSKTIEDLGEITNEDYLKSENVISVSSTGTYYFGWKAYSAADNWNIYVDAFQISLTDAPTAVHDNENAGFKVYPNPSEGRFIVQFRGIANVSQVEVMSLDGRVIKSFQNPDKSEMHINLTDYNNGVYILKVIEKDRIITKKIVKQ